MSFFQSNQLSSKARIWFGEYRNSSWSSFDGFSRWENTSEHSYAEFELGGNVNVCFAHPWMTAIRKILFSFCGSNSAGETYGGGSTLMLDKIGKSITLDFNWLIIPICAYNPRLLPALPPKKSIPITDLSWEKKLQEIAFLTKPILLNLSIDQKRVFGPFFIYPWSNQKDSLLNTYEILQSIELKKI